jgi:hypothetical protein
MKMKGPLIPIVSFLLIIFGFHYIMAYIEAEKYRAISNEMSTLVEDCKKKGSSGIYIRKKCLVLDLEKNCKSYVHHKRLPKERNLEYEPSRQKITVLMIVGKKTRKVDTNSKSSRLDFQKYDIAVAYWPEKKPVGFLPIVCNKDARSQRLELRKIDYDDPNKSTNKWIKSIICPKATITEQEIVNDVSGLIKRCRRAGKNIKINDRKILVWDMHNKSRSSAHGKLPGALKASCDDNRIAVFMIVGKRNENVGFYSISRKPAFRQYIDIAVANWPEKKPVGFYSVVSKDPRSRRPVQYKPEYGDPNIPIVKWIQSVVKKH